jgi:hypothetical protein
VPKCVPGKEDLFEAYAWCIATERRTPSAVWLKYSPLIPWTKYSPEQVLSAYRWADEAQLEIASKES